MFDLRRLVNPHIWQLKPYSSARDEYSGSSGVFLDANENPFGKYNRYPDPLQKSLKKLVSKIKNIPQRKIALGNGSDEIIDIALRIFCSPKGAKALICSPTYGMYQVAADIQNIELLDIPLDKHFQLDVKAIDRVIQDPELHLIFLCSPNNPTGNLLEKSDVKHVLGNFNGIVLIDEAYIDFSKDASLVSWLTIYPNLMIMQTLSKAWGMAALRVGMLFASEEIISLFNKVKPPYNISMASQNEAIKVLSQTGSLSQQIDQILSERALLINLLSQISIVKRTYPSDANFLLIEVDNPDKCYQSLLKQGVVVRNRNKQVSNTLRITVGNPKENEMLIQALKDLC